MSDARRIAYDAYISKSRVSVPYEAFCAGWDARDAHSPLPRDGEQLSSKERFPNPEDDLFSDAMDAAATAFHSSRYGILKNAERAGETPDGERVVRVAIAAAFNAYVGELRPTLEPCALQWYTIHGILNPISENGCLAEPFTVRAMATHEVYLKADVDRASQPPGDVLDALRGLVGLVQLVLRRDDLTNQVSAAFTLNHRYIEALKVVERHTSTKRAGHIYSPREGTEVCGICGFHKSQHAPEHMPTLGEGSDLPQA